MVEQPRHAYARAWVSAGWQCVGGDSDLRTLAIRTIVFERRDRPPLDLAEVRKNRRMREQWMCAAAARRVPDEIHVQQGWHLPHLVYQVHLPSEDTIEVGVSRVGAKRLAVVGGGRELVIVETLEMSRFQAERVEIAVLDATDPWRVLFPEQHTSGGYTERWSDSGPTVDLMTVATELNAR